MNSAGRDPNYYIKRQKNNEAARISKMKRKDKEIQAESDRKKLEAAYAKLHKELRQIYEKRLDRKVKNLKYLYYIPSNYLIL